MLNKKDLAIHFMPAKIMTSLLSPTWLKIQSVTKKQTKLPTKHKNTLPLQKKKKSLFIEQIMTEYQLLHVWNANIPSANSLRGGI